MNPAADSAAPPTPARCEASQNDPSMYSAAAEFHISLPRRAMAPESHGHLAEVFVIGIAQIAQKISFFEPRSNADPGGRYYVQKQAVSLRSVQERLNSATANRLLAAAHGALEA